VMVAGTRADAQALKAEAAAVLAPMGLRLSEAKTRITHIDEGLDFLGYRMQGHQKRGTAKRYVYTYPSVRHEAPCDRAELQGLRRRPVAAGRRS
jgi:RNA-directed DNA polymerase